jgi:hypothetical protein
LAACVLLTAGTARAVTFTDQIERLEDVYAALLDYRPGAPPATHALGDIGVGAELLPVPPIDNRIGAKHEPVSPPAAIPRLRADVGIGAGLSVGAVYIPAVAVDGYTADIVGVSLDYGFARGPFRAAARAFELQGNVTGPITAPSSKDTYTVAEQGADLRAGWAFGPWVAYGGIGSGASRTRLDVASDGSSARFSRGYNYGFAGVSWDAGPWRLTAEQDQTEAYLSHLVLTVRYGF